MTRAVTHSTTVTYSTAATTTTATVCSDTPDHDSGCTATCQTCGGDWTNETRTCGPDTGDGGV